MNENDTKSIETNENDEVVVLDQYDAEGLKKNLETTLIQKKHWRTKAKSVEEENRLLKDKLKSFENQNINKGEAPKEDVSDFDRVVDNFDAIRDLAPGELSELRSSAKELGVDPVKYIKSKAGQALITQMRQTQKTQEATPSPSSRIKTFNGKPVNEVLTSDKASLAEKQAAFESMMGRKGLNQNQ